MAASSDRRPRKNQAEDPSSMAVIFAEGRNRTIVLGAGLFLLLSVTVFGFLLIPENPGVYLFQPDPEETRAFQLLSDAFKVKTGNTVDIRVSQDSESLDRVLADPEGPLLTVFRGGAGLARIETFVQKVPEPLRNKAFALLDRQFNNPEKLMILPLSVDPLGIFWNQQFYSSLGLKEPRSLGDLLLPVRNPFSANNMHVILPGGNDRHLLNFISAFTLALWGNDAYQAFQKAVADGMDFGLLLDMPLPAAAASPFLSISGKAGPASPPASLGEVLGILREWEKKGVFPPDWYRLGLEDFLRLPGPASNQVFIMPASFRLHLNARFSLGYRFRRFPAASLDASSPGMPLMGGSLYLARTTARPSRDGERLSQTADEFFAFVASAEGQEILASTAGTLIPGIDPGSVRDELKDSWALYSILRKSEPGIWTGAFDRITVSRWDADTRVSYLCRRIREYLQSGRESLPSPDPLLTPVPLP